MEDFIDFSNSDTKTIPSIEVTNTTATPLFFNACSFVQGRNSLDNNPFDRAQKLAHRPPDPFDILENEAHFKAQHNAVHPSCEVKVANLLSFSDDNILDDGDKPTEDLQKVPTNPTLFEGPTIYISPANTPLENESPPVFLSYNSTPESIGSTAPGSADIVESGSSTDGSGGASATAKMKKTMEFRKRLLKLSISNSTFNSPVSRRMPQMSGLAEEENTSRAISDIMQEISKSGENMLFSESPLKLVGEEGLIVNEPRNFNDSEKNFDADLKMLSIPMLQELKSPMMELCPEATQSLLLKNDKPHKVTAENTDLTALRARIQNKRQEANNNEEISLLIQNLKSLIFDIKVDDQKKHEAHSLLETLSTALNGDDKKQEDCAPIGQIRKNIARPLVRQGTFDVEVEESNEIVDHVNIGTSDNGVDRFQLTESNDATHSIQSTLSHLQEIPDAMVSSSATYDGDAAEVNEGIVLPEISHPTSPQPHPQQPLQHQPDINDIMEHLKKYLEKHEMAQQIHTENGSEGNATTSLNPTFIVLMNTMQVSPATSGNSNSSFVSSFCENAPSDESPDFSAVPKGRRRSQSLSTHDKVKFLQLSYQPPAIHVSATQDDSPPCAITPPLNSDGCQFKTPSRPIRRNSFSNGTPYTAIISTNVGNKDRKTARRSNCGIETNTKISTQLRRSTALSTHHESQRQPQAECGNMVRAMPMNAFKPDLKKKCKSSISSESVMKSTLPLKATIPIKRVVPELKISPPRKYKSSLNTSMHSLTKPVKMSHAGGTPMPQARNTCGIGSNIPNACSTPTTRSSHALGRNRYSHISTTPSAKLLTPSAAAAGLKRRSISEFKAKSPIKSRLSSNSSATATKTGVLKTASKLSPSAASTSSRLGARASFGGTSFMYRNKENKQP